MQHSEFPNYFQASDNASIKAQKNYLNIIRIDLLSMIVASALAIYNYQAPRCSLSSVGRLRTRSGGHVPKPPPATSLVR
jgi:hypothetical protein